MIKYICICNMDDPYMHTTGAENNWGIPFTWN